MEQTLIIRTATIVKHQLVWIASTGIAAHVAATDIATLAQWRDYVERKDDHFMIIICLTSNLFNFFIPTQPKWHF